MAIASSKAPGPPDAGVVSATPQVVLSAIGGSTNGLIHLTAIANLPNMIDL